MASTSKQAKPRRRTQEERRATTRAALLEATIDCLVEYGYADTTTTKVVERAGLSRGAQVHHFSTKAALVSEAVRYVAEQREQELREHRHDPGDVEATLDLLWDSHTGRLFEASMELWVAARTDEELREHLLPVERHVTDLVWGLFEELVDEGVDRDEFAGVVLTVLATIQGLALQRTVFSKRLADAAWKRARPRLAAQIRSLD